jgi:hypothetical protein
MKFRNGQTQMTSLITKASRFAVAAAAALLMWGLAPTPAHAAESSTNPVAPILQLQLQNEFNPSSYHASGYANNFIFQPVVPYNFAGVPWITRITLPLSTTPNPIGPIGDTTGLGDLTTLNFRMWDIRHSFWGGDFGFGPVAVAPTNTDSRTGTGKWQLGPSSVYINTATPTIEWGLLLYQQWSVGGQGSDSVSQLIGQPVFTKHLNNGWYLSNGDHVWSYDWNTESWDIPIAFGVGREFNIGEQENNVYVIPFYNVGTADPGASQWGIKASWTFLFRDG